MCRGFPDRALRSPWSLTSCRSGSSARSYSTRAVRPGRAGARCRRTGAGTSCGSAPCRWLSSEWDRALEHGKRALAALGEGGALRERSTAAWVVASVLIWRGDLKAALAVSEELVRIGDEKADVETSCVGAGRQGLAQVRLGRLEDADTSLERAVALADAVPDHLNRVETRGDLGKCLLRLGEWQRPWSYWKRAGGCAGEHHVQSHNAVPVLAGLVEVYLHAAEQTEEPAKSQWLEKAARASEASLKNARRFRPALAEAMRLRGTIRMVARQCQERTEVVATQHRAGHATGAAIRSRHGAPRDGPAPARSRSPGKGRGDSCRD